MDRRIVFSVFLLVLMLLPAASRAGDEMSDLERMAQEHKHDHPTPTAAATMPPAQEVTGQEVVYAHVAGKPVKGFLARPKSAKGPLPGIIVIQEWWGLNDNIRQMAQRLAGEGYTALAVDLYGGAVADNPDQAMELMKATQGRKAELEDNLRQAYSYLETKEKAPKIGVIGFFGGKDQGIPVSSVREFEKAMKELNKPVEIHIYEDANHAFANPSGQAYNAKAAQYAWQRTVAFLARYLKTGKTGK